MCLVLFSDGVDWLVGEEITGDAWGDLMLMVILEVLLGFREGGGELLGGEVDGFGVNGEEAIAAAR